MNFINKVVYVCISNLEQPACYGSRTEKACCSNTPFSVCAVRCAAFDVHREVSYFWLQGGSANAVSPALDRAHFHVH